MPDEPVAGGAGGPSPVPPGTGWPGDPATAGTPVAADPAGVRALVATLELLAESGYEYRAKFTNTAGSQTTTAATLTVETPAKVTHSPHDLTAIEGEDASFDAAASGSPEPGVQWEVSTDGGAVWSAVNWHTGAMLIGALLDELERRGLHRGLVTMCAGGGMAPAIIIERI